MKTRSTQPKGKGFIQNFDWGLYPQAEKLLEKEVETFLKHHSFARSLAKKMNVQTSTRFLDWVDHILIPSSRVTHAQLEKLGFIHHPVWSAPFKAQVFVHTHSVFCPILLHDSSTTEVALKPEYLEDFLYVQKIKSKIQGKKNASFRKALVKKEGDYMLSAVERRGSRHFIVDKGEDISAYVRAYQTFQKRKRIFPTDEEGMAYTHNMVKKTLQTLSPSRTADAFFRAEREYWQSRNRAGQTQNARQDKLGLGWGNHDHHTYRSSRNNFSKLIHVFEDMGFSCRERFFAGMKAGWGAQILENPESDIVVFADVDISPHEREMDFAHAHLRDQSKLGTVGLWIGLHGESVLQAGMHHLEARFEFEQLKKDLGKKKINVMAPFSFFPFLKQAFTQGEQWKVDVKRLKRLLAVRKITQVQHDTFLSKGALGSHMENLQRRQGFKGFNQDSVTAIIKATDPRKAVHVKGA